MLQEKSPQTLARKNFKWLIIPILPDQSLALPTVFKSKCYLKYKHVTKSQAISERKIALRFRLKS